MDSIVASALEEICSQGNTWISLSSLWSRLSPPLSPSVKACVWENLLAVPQLQFKAKNSLYGPLDASIQRLEDAEKLDLKIIANEKLRDNFVGLYDARSINSNISTVQRRVLERLAAARTNGVAQNQLAKEFGIEGKNLFYILKLLESRRLIVRQPAIVRTKELDGEGESKTTSCISTNMIYLSRYAKSLGAQQRFEICKEDDSLETSTKENEASASPISEISREDMLIKDFLPAMEAVCSKLEEANGKVLVISDIKQDLGYLGSCSKHRAWRSVCQRLKDAHVVEEFDAVVKNKVERCIRLLKKFSAKDFEFKSGGFGNNSKNTQLKFGRSIQKTDQVLELPLDYQIYDMVDAEGSKGLSVMEVCERLGIDKKKSYSRIYNMFSKAGMHLQVESHKRTTVFRAWTPRNIDPESSELFSNKTENLSREKQLSPVDCDPPIVNARSTQTLIESGPSASNGDFTTPGKLTCSESNSEASHGSPLDANTSNMLTCRANLQESFQELGVKVPSAEIGSPDLAPVDTKCLALVKSPKAKVHQSHPVVTVDYARRERRILERLQEEKFILRAELHKWILNLEKDKCSKVDRKTIDRILTNLQQQGRCKHIAINVPNVTNCGHNRRSMVVLHPSIQNLTPDVISQIHDRIRSFEMGLRGQNLAKGKDQKPVPILDVQRCHNSVDLDARIARSGAMRANGFVLAKMVRAKLLHCFLWDYFSSLTGWENALSSADDHMTHSMFALEDAFGAMPLELFLQVVGSSQKFDDMIKKCKQALRLSDLPNKDYKLLMDTLATGRLSKLVDILRRLKLIRLINRGHKSSEVEEKYANLTHTMELKPYIEEPVFVASSSNIMFLDLRPRIRHDFVLSSREAVDEYWLTLEYCYAASNHRAAAQAFPGSVVHEVFLFRSWASVRVMTADQRAELSRRIAADNAKETLSFKECEEIAKDLNLTLEQVLRAYHDKHERRLNRRKVIPNSTNEYEAFENSPLSSSKKRKRVRVNTPVKTADGDVESAHVCQHKVLNHDTISDSNREKSPPESLDEGVMHQEQNQEEPSQERGLTEEEQCSSVIKQRASAKTAAAHVHRSFWNDEADRQLLMKYVRQRAIHGARFPGVNWASVPELPAPVSACKRRMTILKKNDKFRKALMRLCNLLSERYTKHLEGKQKCFPNSIHSHVLVKDVCKENNGSHGSAEHGKNPNCDEERWDDFNETSVSRLFDDVLELKKMAKLLASRKIRPGSREWSNRDITDEEHDGGMAAPATHSGDTQNVDADQAKDPSQRSGHYRLHQNFKLSNEKLGAEKQVQLSLAISNAVELLKLVFLSMRTAPGMPNLLEDTLRRYSERDLFAAYSYLRDKKHLIGGSSGQPFVLSQNFLHSISKSPFPINTGKRAIKFSNWLLENEADLMAGGVDLTSDLQCGDIFNFFSLVASGELCICASLPEEGVGEREEHRGLKRGIDDKDESESDIAKKLKLLGEGEINFRKEKGFPGIAVSVRRTTLSTTDTIELFKDDSSRNGELHSKLCKMDIDCDSNDIEQLFKSSDATLVPDNLGDSPWQAMSRFSNCMMVESVDDDRCSPFTPEIFETVSNALQKAGDQGLRIEECYSLVDAPEKTGECVVDVLQTFGLALKVNGYDNVRVVDSLYRSKYFLTTDGGSFHNSLQQPISVKFLEKGYREIGSNNVGNGCDASHNEHSKISRNIHKVTILNRPQVSQTSDVHEESGQQDPVVSYEANSENVTSELYSGESCMPIYPWINADGSINKVIFDGLVRRVLGIVMQNPGIPEDKIIYGMDVLNPQSCRKLLELMMLDGHIKVREMLQKKHAGPPSLLGNLIPSHPRKPDLIPRKHFFANPKSLNAL